MLICGVRLANRRPDMFHYHYSGHTSLEGNLLYNPLEDVQHIPQIPDLVHTLVSDGVGLQWL